MNDTQMPFGWRFIPIEPPEPPAPEPLRLSAIPIGEGFVTKGVLYIRLEKGNGPSRLDCLRIGRINYASRTIQQTPNLVIRGFDENDVVEPSPVPTRIELKIAA